MRGLPLALCRLLANRSLIAERKNVRTATLILVSGKMGAGKSTLAKKIAEQRNAVLICEDQWLSTLYPGNIASFENYLHYSSLMRPLVKAHVVDILRAGADVVLDFPANTVKQRHWLRAIATDAGADNELHYLNLSDDTCLEQIAKRRVESPERAAFDTEAMFNEVTMYFQEPTEDEGFNIRVHSRE